ncbi:uncharacterized protein METZ01_LOCUS471647, partial [marine metagenome]
MAVSLGACEPPPDVVVPLYDVVPVENRPIQVIFLEDSSNPPF